MIPVLTSERLTYGPPDAAHVDAFAAFCETERSRWFGGPAPRADAWRGVALQAGHWALRGYGAFFVSETASGTPVGRVGIWHPEGWPEPELAYVVYADFEGRGYAREAAEHVREWAYRTLEFKALASLIAPDNARSIAFAQRLGAVFEAESTYPGGTPCLVYRHPGPVSA